jgi:protein-tyrosine phosphatase
LSADVSLVAPGGQVGWLAGAHLPAEAYWVSRRPVPIVGMAYPARIRWAELAAEGIGHVVCLVDDTPRYDPNPLRLTAVRLQDLYTSPEGPAEPEREAALVAAAAADVVASVREGVGVAVHCRGGRGRTGTVIGAALVGLGLDPDDVVAWLRRLHRARGRQGWPESPWQEVVVRRSA